MLKLKAERSGCQVYKNDAFNSPIKSFRCLMSERLHRLNKAFKKDCGIDYAE